MIEEMVMAAYTALKKRKLIYEPPSVKQLRGWMLEYYDCVYLGSEDEKFIRFLAKKIRGKA